MTKVIKKVFKHGGSYAVDLPISFIRNNGIMEVVIEFTGERVVIRPKGELDTIENDPHFGEFINAILVDAMKNPKKLYDAKEVWDGEWDKLLKGVTDDSE